MSTNIRLATNRLVACAAGAATLCCWLAAGLVHAADRAPASPPSPMQTIVEGRLRFDASPLPPPGRSGGVPIRLPDPWSVERPQATGFAWYSFDWTLADVPDTVYAIYLPGTNVHVQVFVNETLVGTTGDLARRTPQSWERSQAFSMPFAVPREGANRIDVRVFVPQAALGGLAPLVIGPAADIRRIVFRDILINTIGPLVVSATIVVVGAFILMLWARRRDPTYALFGSAAILWGVHTAISILPEPPLPDLHWAIAWHGLYMTFVALLCLFCLRFTGADWPRYRRTVVAFAFAVVPALYAAWAAGVIGPVAVAIRGTAILLVLIALGSVARYALAARNTESALLLAAGAVSAGFAIHDWTVANDPYQIRETWLVPYAALGFLVLVGWILVDRFVRALNGAERARAGLERRVDEKSAQLLRQLERTREARDAAEAANRAKSRFLAAASHDLRQPLHALGLFAAKLRSHVGDEEGVRVADRIGRSVESLEGLLSSLLDISKLDAGAIEVRPQAVALDALFQRLGDVWAPQALERGLKLAIVPTRLAVRTDPLLLERVLGNLLDNAIKVTTRGGVVVGARRRADRVVIEVHDSGPGIAEAERERIFEEFYQLDNPARDRAKGLGLGLAIVRRLATLLGHTIELGSVPGRGTTFRVVAERVAAPEPAPAESALAIPGRSTTLTGRRVLVVEDDEAVRAGLVALLRDWGCRVEAATDAGAARALARTIRDPGSRPEALIVDYRLPDGFDGLAAIDDIRRVIGAPVPALVVSGASSPEDIGRIKASAIPWLSKPVAPARLRAALAFVLGEGGRAPEADPAGV